MGFNAIERGLFEAPMMGVRYFTLSLFRVMESGSGASSGGLPSNSIKVTIFLPGGSLSRPWLQRECNVNEMRAGVAEWQTRWTQNPVAFGL